MASRPLSIEESARLFWAKVDKSGDCWVWTGGRFNTGYGNVKRNGRAQTTHRLAWTLAYGPIPAGQIICHRCDNPPCVRPDHLFLGSHRTNAEDRTRKGRGVQAVRRGGENGMTLLSEDAVRGIRRDRASGRTYVELAKQYGATKANVANICQGRTWRHLD